MNNQFEFIGRITKDLELKSYADGKSVIELPLAVNRSKDETLFVSVKVFGKRADTINLYCKKGDLIGVRGIVRNNNWEDKEGKKHYGYSFIATDTTFLQAKKENVKDEIEGKVAIEDIVLTDEDLPF